MYDISCVLLSTTYSFDSIGNNIETKVEKEIPILKVEDVWQNEFYNANQQGLKPSLRLKISASNYNDERELKYMDKTYTIIRTQNITVDETVLICERKIGNE